jgi:Flp pilus assembly protein TadG
MKTDESSSGQSLLEFALILPLVLALALGVIEVGYALLDQHVVTKLAREGSNLISRNTTLADAGSAMLSMGTRPVDFGAGGGSKLIFSVIKKGTPGTTNACCDIVYQRHVIGAANVANASRLTTSGGTWTGADYTALNADTNTALRVSGLPANLVSPGGFVYVTEIYTKHPLITPFDRLGVTVPNVLYSIAYF